VISLPGSLLLRSNSTQMKTPVFLNIFFYFYEHQPVQKYVLYPLSAIFERESSGEVQTVGAGIFYVVLILSQSG
jgi:hypothetical protein